MALGVGAVQTRQNSLGGALALVPLWDMCNHGEDAGASRLAEDGSLELMTTGVGAGEEVRMDYGDRSAANFLLHSGFVPPPSLREGADTATVDVALPATPLAALLARFLDSRGVPRAPLRPTRRRAGAARSCAWWRRPAARRTRRPDAALNAAALAAGADNKADATYLLRCAPDAALSPASAAHADRATRALAAATAAQAEGYPRPSAATTAHGRLADALSRASCGARRGVCKGRRHGDGDGRLAPSARPSGVRRVRLVAGAGARARGARRARCSSSACSIFCGAAFCQTQGQ